MSSAPPLIRIAIADDHQMFRDGLTRLLETEPGFQVVAEAPDGVEAARIVDRLRPDVLLLDIAMPRMTGLEVLAAVTDAPTRVVLLTAAVESAELLRAFRMGARGVVLKESAARILIDGLHRVMNGRYLVGSRVAEDLLGALDQAGEAAPPKFGLTNRELAVVAAVAGGDSNRAIADRLGISLQTVKHHLTSVFDKTGTSSRLELALFAIRHALVPPV